MDASAPYHSTPSAPAPPAHDTGPGGPSLPQRPAPMRRRGPARRLSLVVLALSLLATALIGLLLTRGAVGLVNGGLLLLGVPVGILGAGIVASGVGRRRGGWMSLLGWPALLVALPVLAVGAAVPAAVRAIPVNRMEEAVGRTTYTWQDLVEAGDGTGRELPVMAGGQVILDLREMPQEAPALSTIHLEVGVGEVRILTREDAPIAVEAKSSMAWFSARAPRAWSMDGTRARGTTGHDGWDTWDMGPQDVWDEEEYTVDGAPARISTTSSGAPLRAATLRSPTAQSDGPALTVRARLGAGQVTVVGPQEVTWAGDASQEVWVVEYWRDETGRIHLDDHDLVVPGMTHPAISARRAQQCVDRARGISSGSADGDADEDRNRPGRDWDAWEDLDELTAEQRQAYRDCAQQAATDREQAAAATPAPGPTTSPAAGPAPSAGTTP